ncbi:hypothetical protein U9M48_032267 [Paspalum notatum var. saurae]|uniref:Uncharacterized protein n=1 Tax=Paspalum notatum var. saurae TaxID=547442 RepID=A0AAQ3U8E5_PASNO
MDRSHIPCFKISQGLTRHFVTSKYGKEMERRHGEGFDWWNAPIDPQAVYSMFNGMIDSRQVQRGSSSQSSGGSSSRQHRTTSEMEIESLRQEIQKRGAFLKAQEEYQKEQQAHAERLHAQQMAAIQAMYQAQGMTFVMVEVAPAPVPPQWGMFAQMSFSPAPQGSGVQGSNPYQTPPPASEQYGDQHIDPALGDFVNNLFTSGDSGHNSNEPGAIFSSRRIAWYDEPWPERAQAVIKGLCEELRMTKTALFQARHVAGTLADAQDKISTAADAIASALKK